MTPRRFNSSGEAQKELFEAFNAWSETLRTYGTQAAYALIAANWAVHGTKLLQNPWAKGSLAIAVVYLTLHLVFAGIMAGKHVDRVDYADANKERWEKEFKEHAGAGSEWPYTIEIKLVGRLLRFLHVAGPVLGGAFFIASMT